MKKGISGIMPLFSREYLYPSKKLAITQIDISPHLEGLSSRMKLPKKGVSRKASLEVRNPSFEKVPPNLQPIYGTARAMVAANATLL